MSLGPGTRLGSYEIVAPIGVGGMGEVDRSRDSKLGRNVALKATLRQRVRFVAIACALFALTTHAAAQETKLNRWTPVRESVKTEIVDGAIRLSEGRGWLRARPAFLDFILRLQFRATTDDAEGAVLIRAYPLRPEEDAGVGVRIGLPRGAGGGDATVTAYAGEVADLEPAVPVQAKRVGEWRSLEIRADRTRISVSIDGTVVRTTKVSEAWAGYVGLLTRTGVMEFRQITIESLPAGRICASAPGPSPGSARPNGVVTPRLRKSVKPRYTPDAIGAGIQGVVRLQGVVLPDGTVGDVCVRQSVDPDLDLQAAAAAREFLFDPGTRDGQPVAVLVTFQIEFVLNVKR